MKDYLERLVSNTDKLPSMDMSYHGGNGYVSENELMRAIILRVIEDFATGRGEVHDDAVHYLNDDDEEYIFSFRSICRTLGFDPGKTRHAIMHAQKKISTRRRAA